MTLSELYDEADRGTAIKCADEVLFGMIGVTASADSHANRLGYYLRTCGPVPGRIRRDALREAERLERVAQTLREAVAEPVRAPALVAAE